MVPRPAFLQNQIIVLVIAHPDDEAIFFGPVLQEITKPEHHNRVIYLCLSTGDIDGQGQVREEEIHQSAAVYGIQETDIHVVDDPKLKDGAEWEKNDIVDVLRDSRYGISNLYKHHYS